MAINDFSTYILNVPEDSIESIFSYNSNDILHIVVKLTPTYPTCPS